MKKLLRSFHFAFAGIFTAVREQRNMQIHLLAVAIVVCAGFFFRVNRSDWCVLVLAMAIVLSLEMVNTAIEYVVNLVSPQQNEVAKKAKDVAAGAVLVAAMAAVVLAALVFAKHL